MGSHYQVARSLHRSADPAYLKLPLDIVLSHVLLSPVQFVFQVLVAADPRMSQDLIRGEPLGRVEYKDILNQGLGLVGDVIPKRRRKLVVTSLDHLKELLVVLLVERRKPAQSIKSNKSLTKCRV